MIWLVTAKKIVYGGYIPGWEWEDEFVKFRLVSEEMLRWISTPQLLFL